MSYMKTMSITETSQLPAHFVGLVHLIQPFYNSSYVPVSISSAKTAVIKSVTFSSWSNVQHRTL